MKIKLLIVILVLLSACSSKPAVVNHTDMPGENGQHEIYIVSHEWHTGIVIPANRIQTQLPALRERFGDIAHIEFGWGDRDYYQSSEATTGITLKAVFWPTDSVIHAVAVPRKVESYFANSKVEKVCISGRGYTALVQYISSSFFKDAEGEIVTLKTGLYGSSQFYEAVGDFHLLNTCNNWTAKGLQSAGLDISPTFKFTAGSVMDYLQDYKQSLTSEGTELPEDIASVKCQ